MNKTSAVLVRTLLLGTSCLSVLGLDRAFADPTGGTVVLGSATITSNGSNSTVITQTSNKALINWDSFSIAAGGTVRFDQPGSSAIAVNRVIGSQPSAIYGSLLANGQVWLINGNGILFGKGSQINVGGLIATTSDLRDQDFANGNYNFSNGTGAAVVNQGTIRTRNGGSAVLSGASVSNQGLIQADAGTVVLGGASSFTVDFAGDNLLRYAIGAPAATATNGHTGVSNSGTIVAAGGRVIMTARAAANVADAVVNNTGMISATSATVQNGEVILDGGDGDVNVGGTIDVTGKGAGQTGGSVTVTGRNITVADNTTIDASGDSGGGTVRIGGDLHGTGDLPDAANVTVGKATIKADATRVGNGGTLVVWSNGLTDFSGIASAMGGFMGGNGGLVETSGHNLNVTADASVDTRAPKGQTGTWLLDPTNIVIQSGEGSGTSIPPNGTVGLGDNPEGTDFIAPDTIVAALANTNVTLEASNEIDVLEDVIYSSPNTLSLLSEGNININASILNQMTTGGGALTLVAGWDGITAPGSILTTPGAYGNNDGEVFLDGSEGNVFVGAASGTTTVAAGEVTLTAGGDGFASSTQIGHYGAGGGDIFVSATGDVSLNGGDPTDGGGYAMIGNGAPAGSVTGNVLGNVTGNVVINAGGAVNLSTQGDDCECEGPFVTTIAIGNANTSGTVSGNVTIFADNIDDFDDANGGLGAIAAHDLNNGDFTAGITDSEFSLDINSSIIWNSAHTLTLLSAGDLDVEASIQNSGSGAVNLVAGWDGVSGLAQLGSAGTFGLNGGSVFLGAGEGGGSGGVFVGSSGGNTAVYADSLFIEGGSGGTQLGFNGGGATGLIHVEATGDIELNADNGYAQIGHGGADTNGSDSGDISVAAGGTISLSGGGGFDQYAQIGHGGVNSNDGQSTSFSYAGNIDVTGSVVTLTGGNNASYAQIGHGGQNVGTDPTAAITETNSGNITVTASAGDVSLTAGSGNSYAQIGHGGAYGGIVFSGVDAVAPTRSDSGAITVQAFGGSVFVTATEDESAQSGYAQIGHGGVATAGSDAGDILVTADKDVVLTGGVGTGNGFGLSYAQIGNGGGKNDPGLDSGNITVNAIGDLVLSGSATADASDYVQIGNGSYLNVNGGNVGPASGNIAITAGATTIDSVAEGSDVWIGNISPNATGTVTLLTGTFDASGDALGDFTRFMAQDINGGDITLGFTDSEVNSVNLPGFGTYNSSHLLTILAAGTLDITGSIQNAGTGAITLVGGWDGTTLAPAHLADAGVYGNNGGTINIGTTSDAPGDVFVGAASGTLNIYTGSLSLNTDGGNAQVGYHGVGGGDINVVATQNINGFGNSENTNTLQLGNGTLTDDVSGNVTGNITLSAGGQTAIFSQTGEAWLGNHASTGFKEVGNVTSVSVTGSYDADYMEGDVGTSSDTGGNVFLGFNGDPTAEGFHIGGIDYTSPHELVFATTASLDVTGSVINHGTGAVTLVSGWDGTTIGTGQQILSAGAYGLNGTHMDIGGDHHYTIGQGEGSFSFDVNQFEDISIGSAGGLTSVLAGDITVMPSAGYYAQIGYHGTGGGNIAVVARGDLTLTAGAGEGEYAMIGNGSPNGDVTGAITGNIGIQVGGTTTLSVGEGAGQAWIGNVAGTGASETGSVTLVTGDLFEDGSLSDSIGADLAGGDVTVAVTDSESQTTLFGTAPFSGAHTLDLLSEGSWTFAGSLQNAGTGATNIVAGWDGSTFDAAHFGDAGVYGNHGGSVTIGGADADGDVAVGSMGGKTFVAANNVNVLAVNGYAQLGYHGTGTGAIVVDASGVIGLGGGASAADFAQIGDGSTLGTNTGSGDVTLSAVSIAGQNSHAVTAANLTLTTTSGGIGNSTTALDIASNTLRIQTGGAPVFLASPTTGVTVAQASLGTAGLTVSAGGAITQTALIQAGTLNLSTTTGAITLTNLANAVSGTVSLNAAGAVAFYNTVATTVGVSSAGSDFTLLSKGNVTFNGSVQDPSGNLVVVAGWDGSTVDPTAFGNSGVYGNNSGSILVGGTGATTNVSVGTKNGTTTMYASAITLTSLAGVAQIGYRGTGGGNIKLVALHDLTLNGGTGSTMVGNSDLGDTEGGAVTGDIDIRIGGNLVLNSADSTTRAWIGNRTSVGGETGNVIVLASDVTGTQDCDVGCFAQADIVGGDVTLGVTSATDREIDSDITYTSSHNLTLLVGGGVTVTGNLQNAGTGAINLVAGWDGHTISPTALGNSGVYGNGGKGVTIGGANADGNTAFGSAGGTTSIYGASLAVSAVHGYAQVGFNGHGTGAIVVQTTGNVTLTGGGTAGQFAQIGNGGLHATGSNNGDIDIVAGGDLTLTGGAGAESYAQIGHGGAESNSASGGYSNVAPITVTAVNVVLTAGPGSAAYVEIGNGGYKSGAGITGGTATNGGDITITASHAVSLTGGGDDGYAQIGNGGSQSNLNPASGAGGTDSGNIVVTTPNGEGGSVTLASGAGANAYTQIGNGGYDINTGANATIASWTVTGNVSVTDLSLTGGNTGSNAYSQIGNGDVSMNGTGNISGDITIDANGNITYTNGTAPHSRATIGNFTGHGTAEGTLTGANPPSDVTNDPVIIGNIASNTANNGSNTNAPPATIATVVITTEQAATIAPTATTVSTAPPGPLASLDGGGDTSPPNASDTATVVIADSLNGAKKPTGSTTILAGMLKQTVPTATGAVHGVPPADQDFSSWGNEALWQ